ncbi:hypothetical protein L195_g035895 [Trifolium pratense]|uniref:Uncharacterized protein n=1 Tax=Trifolium pratense TaxID=57577 RepID=A0A2K3LMZ6_TRIPR|nr:hypothetical protein L195_g035895 [Trifolium pratense]
MVLQQRYAYPRSHGRRRGVRAYTAVHMYRSTWYLSGYKSTTYRQDICRRRWDRMSETTYASFLNMMRRIVQTFGGGHTEYLCDNLYSVEVDDDIREWGPKLRSEVRRRGQETRSRWLRDDEQVMWQTPDQERDTGINEANIEKKTKRSTIEGRQR